MITEHREVRVTPRQSVRMPFVAGDLSPVDTVSVELEKGLAGWTDTSVVLDVPEPDSHKSAEGKGWLGPKSFTVGETVSRKAPVAGGPVVRRPRPTKRRWK